MVGGEGEVRPCGFIGVGLECSSPECFFEGWVEDAEYDCEEGESPLAELYGSEVVGQVCVGADRHGEEVICDQACDCEQGGDEDEESGGEAFCEGF